MKKFKIQLITGSLILLAFISIRFKENYFEISKNLEIFSTLYRELNVFYVDETKPGDLMKTGIDAMLQSLDPYTNYIAESDIEDYRFMTTGQYGGIGALIRSVDGKVYVSEPYENFPAQRNGLHAGDRILSIDGKDITGKPQEEISEMLKGQAGTQTVVKIERRGETLEKSIVREEIKIPDVPYYGMLDNQTGYIRLTSFTGSASKEVKDAFKKLKENQGMKNLVLDLRGNGGGLLRESVNIVNLFVPKGQEVVSTKGKISDWDKTHFALNDPVDTEIPLAILVDEGSASASEIVAGALQDLDRAVVIGRTTFGKGLVQQTRDLQYNSKLKLTVAKYYIPSGRCIQKLDYSHKTADGLVEEVPDSLLKAFKTKGGREVMDGRGIEPDIKIEQSEFPPILGSLLRENLFFLYANEYFYTHDSIDPAADFHLTDAEYQDFLNFLSDKEYHYTTKTEETFNELKKTAEQEKYLELAREAFENLGESISHEKDKDLQTFRADIQEILENEIISRYYYQNGRIEASLANDPYIKEVKNTFSSEIYAGLLDGSVPGFEVKKQE